MFDSHCHLDLHQPASEQTKVWQRAKVAGVQGALIAGVDPAGWAKQDTLARTHPELCVSYGLHPWSVAKLTKTTLASALQQLDAVHSAPSHLLTPNAVGETGLDRSRPYLVDALPLQMIAFRHQLRLASALQRPVILHVVKAHELALTTLSEEMAALGMEAWSGVVHSFGGSPEIAQRYLNLGFHISFSGLICNPKATRARNSAKMVPSTKLLVETDAPDQLPFPLRDRPNECALLVMVIETLGSLRNETKDSVAGYSSANALRLFGVATS